VSITPSPPKFVGLHLVRRRGDVLSQRRITAGSSTLAPFSVTNARSILNARRSVLAKTRFLRTLCRAGHARVAQRALRALRQPQQVTSKINAYASGWTDFLQFCP
jgi:hypothetical protein